MSSVSNLPVMIVGAGPTGLAAALFLARRDVPLRIIDASSEPTVNSKALLVNPRTLNLLGNSGVTARIEAEGCPVQGAIVHHQGREVASIDLHGDGSTPLPVALAQARTEALLDEALHKQGVRVERGVALRSLVQGDEQVTLTLIHDDDSVETAHAPIVFGADGARSAVRNALGVTFGGSALAQPWQLWDLHLRGNLDPQRAHICLEDDGFLSILRLPSGLWRVIGNGDSPLGDLPMGAAAGDVAWQSSFHIAHRLAAHVCVGRVALGGDAAHVHSPLGARGMNLGIEDAWVFADCAADALGGKPERLRDYQRLRHPVHRQLVRRIALMTRLVDGQSPLLRRLRDTLMPHALKLAPVRRRMIATINGLDHPLRSTR